MSFDAWAAAPAFLLRCEQVGPWRMGTGERRGRDVEVHPRCLEQAFWESRSLRGKCAFHMPSSCRCTPTPTPLGLPVWADGTTLWSERVLSDQTVDSPRGPEPPPPRPGVLIWGSPAFSSISLANQLMLI